LDGAEVPDLKKWRTLRGGALSTLETDVAIVGGGPAGCSAALTLRQLGISATLVSSTKHSDRPTETSLPTLRPMLRILGAEQALTACEPCYGICSNWGRKRSEFRPCILNPHGNPWFVHRKRFDQILRESVQKAGVLRLDGTAIDIRFEADGVTIFTDGENIRCRWLVIANGSPAWTARITGQKISRHDVLTAIWGRIPHARAEQVLVLEPSEFGWWYVCPDDGSGCIACLITDPSSARKLGATILSNWNDLFRATRLSKSRDKTAGAEKIFAAATGLMSLSYTQKDRWIAIGDAAAKLDPIGSAGTMTALDGGRRAARAIFDSLKGDPAELQKYARWSAGLIREFARQREQHYLLEATKHSTEFWHCRSAVDRSPCSGQQN